MNSEPEVVTSEPIGWFAIVNEKRWQGFFLYTVHNGQFVLPTLVEAGLMTDREVKAVLKGKQPFVAKATDIAVDHLLILFRDDPQSRSMCVWGSLIAFMMQHAYFLIEWNSQDNSAKIIKMPYVDSIDEARLTACNYPAIKALECHTQPLTATMH
jgi:hypothetical protein